MATSSSKTVKPAPSTKPVAAKLLIKPDMRVAVLFAPDDVAAHFASFAVETAPKGQYQAVVLFAGSLAEATSRTPRALKALAPGGLFWLAYPKGGSAIKTDINRDKSWAVLEPHGFTAVTQVAIDATWSALRFRPASEVGK